MPGIKVIIRMIMIIIIIIIIIITCGLWSLYDFFFYF